MHLTIAYTHVGADLTQFFAFERHWLGLDIVVSEQTYTAIRPLFQWKPAGTIAIRGRTDTIRAYSVEGTTSRCNSLLDRCARASTVPNH
jgi:hypothetical protein